MSSRPAGALLVDTNLLVLWIVGTVNRGRIRQFKRTCQYTEADFDILDRYLATFSTLYTLAHVMAEVSNLTDLSGPERLKARLALKSFLETAQEPHVPSSDAARTEPYNRLGLVDSAISVAARRYRCRVLTDDLALFLALSRAGVEVENFNHLRPRPW